MVDKNPDEIFDTYSMHLRIESTVSTTPLFRSKSFLNQKYTVEGLSARQIAVLIGCGHSTINSALKRHGLATEARESGWVQYGTKLAGGLRMPHVREQMIIDTIRRMRASGWSYHRINHWLHRRGIRCPSGRGRWHSATVRRIYVRSQIVKAD
jgi:IS30 family transposase